MRKITINCAKNKFFWVNEAFDILTLRYQFRLIGNLIKIPKLGSKFNFFLFLSIEEVLIGLEAGFLKIKILNKNKNGIKFFLYKKLEKNFYQTKKGKNFKISHKRTSIIKNWRETSDLIAKTCIFKFKRKGNCPKKQSTSNHSCKTISSKSVDYHKLTHLGNFIKNFTESDFFKYSVFKNFWQKGFSLSCGIKFGASFLCYAGDISNVHSCLSVLILPIQNTCISPKLFIAFGRVGTATKKFNVLVNLNKNNLLDCSSIRWHNFLP